MTGRAVVDFYYSVGSRYSYLASTRIDALERETECEVRWLPLFSRDLMALRGNDPFRGEPVSGQYEWPYRRYDAESWAEYYGVPYREPEDVDFDPRLMARACVAADRLGKVRPYSISLFQAVFVEGVPKIDEEECARRAEEIDLTRSGFLDSLRSSSVDEQLFETTHEARSKGAFGVPTFVAGDRMFWGNDRLVLLRHYLLTYSADAP